MMALCAILDRMDYKSCPALVADTFEGTRLMARGKASGIQLTTNDARIVLGMVARDDREHDIAAWFGVNQGRVAEAKAGEYGTTSVAPASELPPKGPPGPKGRRLHATAKKAAILNPGSEPIFPHVV
jgi:hypothetical protein